MKTETRSFYEAAVERAALRIARTLDEALDLGAIAREAALSSYHFHRIFRGMLGETPLELHRRLRLERAAHRLRDGETTVTTVAFEAGYDTHEAFTRAFRQAYGTPPSGFRQAALERALGGPRPLQIELAAPSGIHFRMDAIDPVIRLPLGETSMDVIIETLADLRVATVRHVGPYQRIPEAFARLGALVGRAGLIGQGSMMIAIYHDDPETTPASELRSDAGVSVADDARLPDGLGEQRLGAGLYARTTHVGPYTELGDAWSRFMGQWLPKSGYRIRDGESFEVYRNTPEDTRPEALRTDLYLPIHRTSTER